MKSEIFKFINKNLNINIDEQIDDSLVLLNKYPMLKFLNDRNYLDEEFKNYILEKVNNK